MSELLPVSERILNVFGADAARELVIRPLRHAKLTVLQFDLSYDEGAHRVILADEDAFLLVLYLIDVEHSDILHDERLTPIRTYPKGSICLVSLKEGAAISVQGRFEALAIHIPAAHFLELYEEAGEPQIESFTNCRGVDDQVVRNLGAAIMPMFDMPDEVRDNMLPHIGLALLAHLAHRYGKSPVQQLTAAGLLTTMQERRIKMYMKANLSRDIGLDDIAAASGFQVVELCTGFEQTTGQTVEEWLLESRISRAKHYLSQGCDIIVDIAKACGFANVKAFEEAFCAALGFTPKEWRTRTTH